MASQYDQNSVESIFNFAKEITGKSLRQAVGDLVSAQDAKHKGLLGDLVERFYFQHTPPNNTDPDFPHAGLELKTTGLKKTRRGYVVKERLKLTKINFTKIVQETWDSSALLNKCRLMLIMFYDYDSKTPPEDRIFRLPPLLYEMTGEDLPTIKSDWHLIQAKVFAGQAHQLSSKDTFYLEAVRSGAGGSAERPVTQPYSDDLAWSRSFALKQSYVNKLVNRHESGEVSLGRQPNMTLEQIVEDRFRPFVGQSISDLMIKLNFAPDARRAKSFNHQVVTRILAGEGTSVRELNKAGVEIKTIRVGKNGMPKESMSFPYFDFIQLASQTWETSDLLERIDRKFLFVIFRIGLDGVERFEKMCFWSMPFSDMEEVRRVWEKTQLRIKEDSDSLPKSSESPVAHVRPHGKNSLDTLVYPSGRKRVKSSFWLNRKYIETVIKNLLDR